MQLQSYNLQCVNIEPPTPEHPPTARASFPGFQQSKNTCTIILTRTTNSTPDGTKH